MCADVKDTYTHMFGWDGSGGVPYSVRVWMICITISMYRMYFATVYIPSAVPPRINNFTLIYSHPIIP